ncbi:hypothetical protein FKM82_014463 [Ascaphus truei]
MIALLAGALLLALAVALFSFWKLPRRSHGKVNYPRSLPSLPVIGSLLHLGSHLPPHLLFCSLQKKYGSLYSLMMGSHYVVIVNNHEHAKEVLLKKGKTFAGRPRTVTSDLLTRDAKDIAFANYSPSWKFHRKLVHSALSMFGEGTIAIEKIRQEAFCGETVNDLMDALLKAKLSTENNNSNISKEVGLSDDHLLMTVGDIFGAGVETTTTVLKWIIAYLLHYPEVQRKIQEELDMKVGLGRHPVISDRRSLPYLEATISEVLRIRPVSPLLIPHVALRDSSIGEYTIPKEARVVINLWSLHHDEKEWADPEVFNPDRFLDEDGNHVHSPSPSYLPFGAGIRVCLGKALAEMELFLFLSWILQRFSFETTEEGALPDLEGEFGVVLQVKKFKVTARLREVWEQMEIST